MDERRDFPGLAEAQAAVDRWVREHGGYWDPMSLGLRLVEEVGELARELNHRHGAKRKRPDQLGRELEDELGDLTFILACIANAEGVDLGPALARVIEKYDRRDAGRWTGERRPRRLPGGLKQRGPFEPGPGPR